MVEDARGMDERIREYCRMLNLPVIYSVYREESVKATQAKLSYQEYLHRLLQQQILVRVENSINAKIKKARFPFIRTLEEFDFSFQPKLDEELIRELSTLVFLDEAKNLIFLGPPGVGKTHLAVAFGVKACQARKRVMFFTAEEMVKELISAEVSGRLSAFLEVMGRIDLLIIDELGYLEMGKEAASLFFKLISKRYEKGSIIVTSNKPFQEWGEIFSDDVVAAAILDRLLHHSYPFLIEGKSYRLKEIFGEKGKKEKE